MNLLKNNFKRNESIGSKICITLCMQELDNEHLVFFAKKLTNIQNRSLELKVEALKQAKSNDEQRKKEGSTL